MRSRWKSLYFVSNLLYDSPLRPVKTVFYNRSILPRYLINSRLEVYNGKKFESFLVKDFSNLKFRFADFVTTKKRGKIHTAFNRNKKVIKK